MNLRPHHILCVQNYIGCGYNKEFTRHMDNITERLCPEEEIVINEGCDDICSACPHKKVGKCTSLDKVDRMDREILNVCSLNYRDSLNWKDAESIAKENVFETEEFSRICGSCQWYNICRDIQVQIRRIERYESIMQEAELILAEYSEDNAETLHEMIKELEGYYGSKEWKKDFADDEAGRLPQNLKRGVLSEDGLYDLLEKYRDTDYCKDSVSQKGSVK